MWRKLGKFLLQSLQFIVTGGETFSVRIRFDYPPQPKSEGKDKEQKKEG